MGKAKQLSGCLCELARDCNRLPASGLEAHTLVLKLILGGLKGYSAGNLTSNLNLPPSYGVPSGPVVNVARWFVQVLVLWPALNCVCECVVVQL